MTDATLVTSVLVVGGIVFLSIFMWVTVKRVRELGKPSPPPDRH